MKYVPWFLTALFALLAVAVMIMGFNPSEQIGIVDIERVLEQSPKAADLNNQFVEKYNDLVEQLSHLAEESTAQTDNEPQTLENNIDNSSPNVEEQQFLVEPTDPQRVEKERQLYAEYLQFRQDLENDFQADLDKAIAGAAKAENVQLVFDEDLVRFGGKDITSAVIKRLQ